MAVSAEQVAHYRHLRQVCMNVNTALMEHLPDDVFAEGAQRLGMLRGKALLVGDENEMPVVMDYSLHDVIRSGQSVVQKAWEQSPYPPDSDEGRVHAGLCDAYFSIFLVESTEPGAGAHVLDALRGERLFLHDIGLGTSATPGMVFPARVFRVDGMWMTTGAPLPASQFPNKQAADRFLDTIREVRNAADVFNNPTLRSTFNAQIIRMALQNTGPDAGPEDDLPYRPQEPVRRSGRWVGRNDPCPCGSGKKFKKCCGTR